MNGHNFPDSGQQNPFVRSWLYFIIIEGVDPIIIQIFNNKKLVGKLMCFTLRGNLSWMEVISNSIYLDTVSMPSRTTIRGGILINPLQRYPEKFQSRFVHHFFPCSLSDTFLVVRSVRVPRE